MDILDIVFVEQNPAAICPPEIFDRQVPVAVRFFDFKRRKRSGLIIVDHALADDVRGLFDDVIYPYRFPITSAMPVSIPSILFDDDRSMALNNTSGFNFRPKYGRPVPLTMSEIDEGDLSLHAFGQAIDINPFLNPWIRNGIVKPDGASYEPGRRGTLTAESPVVKYLKARGWTWGGDWDDPKDYQHFEKRVVYRS